MKLIPELVPRPAWGQSLARMLPKAQWDKLREKELLRARKKCELCGSQYRLSCHEKWEYRRDGSCFLQILSGFEILCSRCHAIRHLGRTVATMGENNAFLQSLIRHFSKVNGISDLVEARRIFWQVYHAAIHLWEERSRVNWSLCLPENIARLLLGNSGK